MWRITRSLLRNPLLHKIKSAQLVRLVIVIIIRKKFVSNKKITKLSSSRQISNLLSDRAASHPLQSYTKRLICLNSEELKKKMTLIRRLNNFDKLLLRIQMCWREKVCSRVDSLWLLINELKRWRKIVFLALLTNKIIHNIYCSLPFPPSMVTLRNLTILLIQRRHRSPRPTICTLSRLSFSHRRQICMKIIMIAWWIELWSLSSNMWLPRHLWSQLQCTKVSIIRSSALNHLLQSWTSRRRLQTTC